MSSTLFVTEIGHVGVSPRHVFLVTPASLIQVEAPGFINQVESSSNVDISPDDFIFAQYGNPATLGMFTPSFGPGNVITLIPFGAGGGSNFDFTNSYFVAKGGSDANNGKSINTPKLTIAGAVLAVQMGTPAAKNVIYIVDSGTYREDVYIPGTIQNLTIVGMAATWEGTGGGSALSNQFTSQIINLHLKTLNTLGAAGAQLNCIANVEIDTILGGGFGYSGSGQSPAESSLKFNSCDAILNISSMKITGGYLNGNIIGAGPSSLVIDVGTMIGDITGNALIFMNCQSFEGDYLASGEFNANITRYKGDYLGTGRANLNIVTFDGALTAAGPSYGSIINAIPGSVVSGDFTGRFGTNFYKITDFYGSLPGGGIDFNQLALNNAVVSIDIETGAFFALNVAQSNTMIVYDSNTNADCQLPDFVGNPLFPVGFRIWVAQFQEGNVKFVCSDPIESVSGKNWTEGRGSVVQATIMAIDAGQYIWSLSGDIAGSAATGSGVDVYVSKLSGSDTTGIGSITQPYASISAAITALGAPLVESNIVVLDDEFYDEALVFNDPKVNLIAEQAVLICTVGDAITVNHGERIGIYVGGIVSLANALVGTADPTIFLRCGVIFGPASNITMVDGSLNILIAEMSSDITVTGLARVQFVATKADGTFVPGAGKIQGITPTRAVTSFQSDDSLIAVNDVTALTGTISTQAGNIIANGGSVIASAGNLQAGSPFNLGRVLIYPSTGNGTLRIDCGNNLAVVGGILSNQPLSTLTTWDLPANSLASSTLMNAKFTQIDPASDIIYFDTSITSASLAGGASATLIAASIGAQYRIRELFINSGGINFSGGGGDRNLLITDGTTNYSVIPAATAQALVNARWGSTDVPFPASSAINTLTGSSVNLTIVYSGGTTDYSNGTIRVSGSWERVV